jgi:exosortase/archaeosortase family protein
VVETPPQTRRVSLSPVLSSITNLRMHFCIILLNTFVALVLDYLLAPSLYNGSTLWATGALFVLTWGGKKQAASLTSGEVSAVTQTWRFLLFALFHIAFIFVGRALAPGLHTASLSYTLSSGLLALTKLLALLPTVVLLPLALWRRVAKALRPELLASLVVLLTFFPQRMFATFWPWYSQILGYAAYSVARLFVPNLVCVTGPVPALIGPRLDVSIILPCSGIDGVRLFDLLFGVIVAVEWKWLDKGRALLAYLVGIATVLMANAVRISLLVILGNRGLSKWVVRQHVNIGWAVFSLAFLAFLWIAYDWMLRSETLPKAGHDAFAPAAHDWH